MREGPETRQARGIYAAARHAPTAEHSLALVAARVPEAVFCLLTALRDFSHKHRGRVSELARIARICRVSRVMQPYLDAIS